MVAVSGTARTSGYLRDKTLAQWIALNRLSEVRLNVNKFGQNTDTGELDFANRKWHYDTRYFDTSIGTMKRVVVRVYAGDAKTKGNPRRAVHRLSGSARSARPAVPNAGLDQPARAPTAGSRRTPRPSGTRCPAPTRGAARPAARQRSSDHARRADPAPTRAADHAMNARAQTPRRRRAASR